MRIFRLIFLVLCGTLVFSIVYQTANAQDILPSEDSVWSLGWSPDGQYVAIGRYDGRIQIFQAATLQETGTIWTLSTAKIVALAWSPDASQLAASSIDGQAAVYQFPSGQLQYSLNGQQAYITDLAWSPDGTRLAGISQLAYMLQIWSAETGELLIQERGVQAGLDWFQNSIAIGSGNGIHIMDGLSGMPIKAVALDTSDIITLAWNGTGTRIASGNLGGVVRIWDTDTSHRMSLIESLLTLNGHTSSVTSVDWNPSGTRLASVGYDGILNIWDMTNGSLLESHQLNAPLLSVGWSPDGNQIAYSGDVALLGENFETFTSANVATPTSTPTSTPTLTPTATPPSSALVLGLGFEEGSGTTAVDSSTYQNAGTLLNGATWTTEGKFGSAIAFDGVDDRVSVADANSLDLTTGLTVEAWVKPTQANDWSTIVVKELMSGESYVLYNWYYGANTAAITTYDGYERIVQGGGLLPLNTWTHVAMTFDGAEQILYLNGQVAGSANVNGAIATSDLPLSIGGNGLFSNEVFQGVIDEVRVYNVALSQTEIQQDMNSPVGTVPYSTPTPTPLWTPTPMATPPSSALVLGLGFEAGSGTTAVDSSTYQNDGTLLNGATWTTEGKFGNAIAFDGVDDRVSVADANSLDLTTGLTVEAWVKPTQVNDWSTIVMKELMSGESYILYGWYYGTNTAAITSYDGYARIVQGGGLLPLNTWTHVAMTFDGAEQILYINGQVIASQTVIGTITTSDLPLSIGGNGLFSNEVFQGVIDEVRVYNVALSQTEIQQDMNSPVE